MTNGFHLELVSGEIFWLLLLKGLALLARSFRISSLNFEPYLQSEINKSPINTTALFLTLFSSATELSRSCQGAGEQRIKPSHVGRAGASSGSLSPPRRRDRVTELQGGPRMAHRGGEPHAELQGLRDGGGSSPG
ncbi:hypothetical protein Q9966_013169 [Columba livia]|uniref:Selenoprotein P, plasma, 1 n=1 Tax=Columba livia TaxID=8932 RepID=A0A2I0LR91_COLLI|nr:hypothetical protein Q9966_013169 [Columba livia]PKK19942.1 selenoprotein P, plasma, 1 [Columba livia]